MIWQKDNEKFDEFEKRKQDQKRTVMKEYFNSLSSQIEDKQLSKKLTQARMNENEALLNKHLLDELDSIRKGVA